MILLTPVCTRVCLHISPYLTVIENFMRDFAQLVVPYNIVLKFYKQTLLHMIHTAINAAILSAHVGVLHVHVHDCLPSLHVVGKQSCSQLYSTYIF